MAFAFLLAAFGCGDDVTSADGSGSSTSGSSGVGPSTGATATTAVSGSSGEGTTGSSSGSGTTVAASTGASSEGSSSGSGGTTGSGSTGSTSSSTGETGGETGGFATVCEEGGELVLQWGLQVPDGTFPDDIPEDLTETCSFTPSALAGELPLSCEDANFVVTIESTPLAVLPDEAQSVEVRIHRQPGPLGFPDFWVQLDFANGQRFTLVNASVLQPNNDTVELPYGMALSDEECGPFNIGTPFQPKDICGDQMWFGLELELDASLTVFHGAHAEGASGGADIGFWVASARDYGVLPKFCDFSATFYSAMVVAGVQ